MLVSVIAAVAVASFDFICRCRIMRCIKPQINLNIVCVCVFVCMFDNLTPEIFAYLYIDCFDRILGAELRKDGKDTRAHTHTPKKIPTSNNKIR